MKPNRRTGMCPYQYVQGRSAVALMWTPVYMTGMPRPQVDEELLERVEELTDGAFRLSDDKVPFQERLRLIVYRLEKVKE
jgi:O-phosphoseryl-tRNA(Cys) synthetase